MPRTIFGQNSTTGSKTFKKIIIVTFFNKSTWKNLFFLNEQIFIYKGKVFYR